VRASLVEVLRDAGYRVTEATDGWSGLAALRSAQAIDLLLTDIGLPGINGRQLAEQAREIRPGIKVLLMTGYAETAVAGDFVPSDMGLITKPFDLDELSKRIRAMLTN